MKNDHFRGASVTVLVDGVPRTLAAGSSVAAALAACMPYGARRSVSGEARAAFCGMGICHECRCTIDGRRRLACQTLCVDGMRVESDRADAKEADR